MIEIQFTINEQPKTVQAWPMARLLDVLREELHLTGTKEGCGEGECGACSILLNGELVNSCLVPAIQANGAAITTVEGLADGATLNSIQQAFVENGGIQCGACSPGMILASIYLLRKNPNPTANEIREGLAGNLCRCTGYSRIFEAVVQACQTARQKAGATAVQESK